MKAARVLATMLLALPALGHAALSDDGVEIPPAPVSIWPAGCQEMGDSIYAFRNHVSRANLVLQYGPDTASMNIFEQEVVKNYPTLIRAISYASQCKCTSAVEDLVSAERRIMALSQTMLITPKPPKYSVIQDRMDRINSDLTDAFFAHERCMRDKEQPVNDSLTLEIGPEIR